MDFPCTNSLDLINLSFSIDEKMHFSIILAIVIDSFTLLQLEHMLPTGHS